MEIGAITGYVDLAQLLLYAFWLFFAGLIYYLVREGHREGYPMETDGLGQAPQGWPIPSSPKIFKLADGSSVVIPDLSRREPQVSAVRTGSSPGLPIEPVGDPMFANAGPGGYAMRADVADKNSHGDAAIAPLRVLRGFSVAKQDVDPRGLPVVCADGKTAGIVREVWVDRSEMVVRYLEVAVPNAAKGPHVMLPINFARVGRDKVRVASILGHHLTDVPRIKNPDEITMLEEERVMAYYGAGTLYAEPSRMGPWI